jgi:phosphoglycolate phosphatase-like HAD superfamily hydrolase
MLQQRAAARSGRAPFDRGVSCRMLTAFVKAKVILFDIDGTLIRTGGAGMRAFARTAQLLFDRPNGVDGLHFHGRTDTALIREFLHRNGFPTDEEHRRRFLDGYLFLLAKELERQKGDVCPGVRRLLEGLRSLPEPPLLGLLTGNIQVGATLKLAAHGLGEEFAVGGYGDDHEDRNRLAAVARDRAAAKLGKAVDPREIIVVGDTRADIECAQSIGARCLAVATGGASLADLLVHSPDLAVETLEGLTPERVVTAGHLPERITNWEQLYQIGDTGWDLGGPAPGLADFLSANPQLDRGRVVAPGCGRGHDVRAFAEAGFSALGLDVAPSAVAAATALTPMGMAAAFQLGDFLNDAPSEPFDWLFEHTLFCAIQPDARDRYADAVRRWVRPGGSLLAIHYLQPSGDSGPPFPVTVAEVQRRFSRDFDLIRSWTPRSSPSRTGRERMFWWRRRG